MINGIAELHIIDDPTEIVSNQSPAGKPFLRIKLEDGRTMDITTNLAEMIGGAGAGARLRHEDKLSKRGKH